jgi:membrane protease YdiL (CAAX protease family)
MFSEGKPLSALLYVAGVVVIFALVYLQYFIHLGPIVGYALVYGVPVVIVSVIFGRMLYSRAAKNNQKAFKVGLGLFGLLTLVGLFLSVIAIAAISQFEPNVINLLSKPNPVLDVPPQQAWLLIAISMLVIGPAEEILFRGFMYGGLLSITKGRGWLPLAIVSSLMFAAVHAYYAVTYVIASAVPFITLTVFGVAMSLTYYWSGGNLIAAIIIHGLYDATGFLGVATANTNIGLAARFILILIGSAIGIYLLLKKIILKPYPPQTQAPSETQPPAVPPENNPVS